MSRIVRNTIFVAGSMMLGLIAGPFMGCGRTAADRDGAAPRSDSALFREDGGQPTGTGGQTGYECSVLGGASGTSTVVPRACYPIAADGAGWCSPRLCGCLYHPVTGCLCADSNISPCLPADPTCTEATAHGTAGLLPGPLDKSKNVSCKCDENGYWWCAQ